MNKNMARLLCFWGWDGNDCIKRSWPKPGVVSFLHGGFMFSINNVIFVVNKSSS